jgi:hypothetical protein
MIIELQHKRNLPSARTAMLSWRCQPSKDIALLVEGVNTSTRTYKHSSPPRDCCTAL